MKYRVFVALACAAAISSAPLSLYAQEMDVDQADSLNFQSFHKDKKEAVKVWDKKSETPTKAYSDQPAAPVTNSSTTVETTSVPASSTAPGVKTAEPKAAQATQGKRFELRERYTLTRSPKTPYSAFYVIEPLYKQAAQLCAKGWKKLAERSEPIEQDYYLYYEIECL
jgi:Flp pilus assembly protein TadG